MNIPFLSPAEKDETQRAELQKRAYAASKTGPRGKLPTPGQLDRHIRRIRHRDAVAMGKKSRRNAFLRRKDQEATHATLVGWSRVYFDGAGSEAMRRNVTEAVHRQAELYSKSAGVPFTRALELAEEAMRDAAVRAAARRWAKAA